MRRARVLSPRVVGVVAAAAAALTAAPAAASPEDLFGYGGRTSAMGATGVAHAGGYESAWHNPALASTIRDKKLTLGYGGAVFGLRAAGEGLPGRVPASPLRGMFIGADVPIPFGGALRDRVGVALAFYTPADLIVRGRVLYPERPQFPLLPDRAQSLTVRGGVGADLGRGIKVGAGFAALAEIVGTVVAATDVTGRVGTRVEDQLVATYAPVLGATYDVPGNAKLRVGLAYRGRLDARFGIVVDGSKLSSLAIPLFNISGVAQYDPAQVAVEVARVAGPSVLAAQLVYKRWSAFPGVLEPTVVCTEGAPGDCGLTPPAIDWGDTVAARVGAEHGFALARGVVLRVRGGGAFESSALPSDVSAGQAFDMPSKQTVPVPTRYFDAARVALTAGAGVSLAEGLPPVDLDVFGQYHALVPRTIRSVDAGEVLSEGEVSGDVKVFGLTAGVRF